MDSQSYPNVLFKKSNTLNTHINNVIHRQLHKILMFGAISGAVISSMELNAATLTFESSRIDVAEPNSGSVLVSVTPTLIFASESNTGADIESWQWLEQNFSPCSVTGRLVARQAGTTATQGADYQDINGTEFELTTAPSVDEGDFIQFDDVSQEVLFEIFADEDSEGNEQIEIEFADLSISCAEGNANLTAENYGTALINISEVKTSRAIPQRQRSLASQLDDMRFLTLETATTRNRRISDEIKYARETNGVNTQNLSINLDGVELPSIAGAGAGDTFDDYGRWGFFVNGSINIGSNKTNESRKSDYNASTLLAGIDYRASDNFIIGSTLSYIIADSGSRSFAKTEFSNSAISLFGSYYTENSFYIDTIVTFGFGDYDLTRTIETGSSGSDTAWGSTNGDETSFAVGTGYSINKENSALRLFSLINYIDANIDGYTETTSVSSSAASINDIDLQSLTMDTGMELSWNINTDTGVYLPSISLAWVRQFKDDAVDIQGNFMAGPDEGEFNFNGPNRDQEYLNAKLGVIGVFANGFNAYFTYETNFIRKDISLNHYTIGARWEF